MNKFALLVLAAAFIFQAGAVTICYEGRLLDSNGEVKANYTSNPSSSAVTAYGDAGANNILASKDMAITTDANGCFAVSADLDVGDEYSVFWVGVTVDNVLIKPLMKVNPAPFALVAAEAVRIESDKAIKLTGSSSVGSLKDGAAITANNVTLNGDLTLMGDVEKTGAVYIKSLDVGTNGNIGMLHSGNPNNISSEWDTFPAEAGDLSVTLGGLFSTSTSFDSWFNWAEHDGFAMVMVKASAGNSSGARVDLEIQNEGVEICSFGSDEDALLIGSDDESTTVVRLFTFPVQAGNFIRIRPSCKKPLLSSVTVNCDIKIRYIYF